MTVTAEGRHVVVNATVQIVTIAQVSQIWRRTQIPSQKRGQRWSDLFIFFIELEKNDKIVGFCSKIWRKKKYEKNEVYL